MLENGVHLQTTDEGKVILFNILTLNERYQKQNTKELEQMRAMSEKYGTRGLSIFGVFAYDLEARGEQKSNKQIA